MFRMNILTLIANTLGSCENSSTVNFTILKNVFEGNDVSDIDWCSYIIECASVSKLDWATKLKKGHCVLWASDVLDVKRRLPTFKSWNTSLLKKREIAELQNDHMRIGEIQDDAREGEEPNQKEELYEMLEENIHNILIEKSEIEEKINENLIKFQDDEKLLQLKQRMKEIFKEPEMPEYLSSSSIESDDDNDDGSQLTDENEESYRKEKYSNDEDDVEIVAKVQKDKRNETHYIAEYSVEEDHVQIVTETQQEEKNKILLQELYEMLEENINNILIEKSEIEEKINESLIKFQDDEKLLQLKQRMKDIFKEPDMPEYLSSSSSESDDDNDDGSQLADENEENEQETGTSKKDEADNNKEEGVANKKVTNQKITKEIDPFDDPKFSEYYIENEHLFVPTQTSAEKKKDQIDAVNWESFLENKEKIIRKGREFSDELRKKAQQQERER
ncbi:hypothetical protein Tco_0580374 [Tanacetum coccineum]